MFEDDELLNTGSSNKIKTDDGYDYTGVIVAMLKLSSAKRSAIDIKIPKPIKVFVATPQVKPINIGERKRYSYEIMFSIFQLNRIGRNEKVIAKKIGVPVADIRRILKHETQVSRKAWVQAYQFPLVSEGEILSRLAKAV